MSRFSLCARIALALILLTAVSCIAPSFAHGQFGGAGPVGGGDPFADPFGGGADPFGGGDPAGDPFAEPDPFGGAPAARPVREIKPARAKPAPQRRPATEEDVLAALDKPVAVDFVEIPLEDAAAFLGDFAKINVELDERALADVGIAADTPVTRTVKGITLRSTLRLMLRELDLTYVIDGGALVITTPDAAEREDGPGFVTEVYPVGHLLRSPDPLVDEAADNGYMLLDLVTYTVRPTTWEDVGGPGSASLLRDKLVVNNTREVHDEVKDLLKTLDIARKIVATGGTPKFISLPDKKEHASAAEKKILAELAKPTAIEFLETPLGDIVRFLSDRHKINIQLDTRALDDVGIGHDTPTTRSVKGVSLAAALRLVLREMDLTYVIRDEVLLITTPEECESELTTRVFPVHDLVFPAEDGFLAVGRLAPDGVDYDSLIDLFTSTVRPTAWEEVGGPGSIRPFGGCLVFSQTDDVFVEAEELLSGIRKLKAQYDANPKAPPTRAIFLDETSAPRLARLRAALAREVGMMAFRETSLVDVIEALSDRHDVPIQIDHRALDDVGIGSDQAVTATLGGESLGAALRRILRRYDLTWVLRDEVILITTPEEAESELLTRIYPARDLVTLEDGDVDVDSLIDTLVRSVGADTWADVGGPGTVEYYDACFGLVVSQAEQVHEEVAGLMAKIRATDAAGGEQAKEDAEPVGDEEVRTDEAGKRVYLKVYRLSQRDREEAGELAETIQDLIAPQSWKADEAYYLKPLAGAIIIRHTAESHRKIHRLLKELDALAWPKFGGGGLNSSINSGGTGNWGGQSGAMPGGVFSVPDHIRGQFATGSAGWLQQSPTAKSVASIASLSLPAEVDRPAMPLLIYKLQNVNEREEGREIAETIRELVAVDDWNPASGAYLRPIKRRLIVRHHSDVQRRVLKLLRAMAEIEAPQHSPPITSSSIPVVGQKQPISVKR